MFARALPLACALALIAPLARARPPASASDRLVRAAGCWRWCAAAASGVRRRRAPAATGWGPDDPEDPRPAGATARRARASVRSAGRRRRRSGTPRRPRICWRTRPRWPSAGRWPRAAPASGGRRPRRWRRRPATGCWRLRGGRPLVRERPRRASGPGRAAGAAALASTGRPRGCGLLAGRRAGPRRWHLADRWPGAISPLTSWSGARDGWLAWPPRRRADRRALAGAATGGGIPRGPARTFLPPARIRALARLRGGPADPGRRRAAPRGRRRPPDGPIADRGPAGGRAPGLWADPGAALAGAGAGPAGLRRSGPHLAPPARTCPRSPLADAAVGRRSGSGCWRATGALLALPLAETAAARRQRPGADAGPAPRLLRAVAAGCAFLPRLVLTASHTQQRPRREQRLLAFAEFPSAAGAAAPPPAGAA